MSNPDVWMPVYIGDYMADTAHLGALEHGAYLMLMFHYWRHHSLPQDDAKLSRIAKCTAREWASIKDTILSFFGPDLSHKRIDRELDTAGRNYSRRRGSGSAGAEGKWGHVDRNKLNRSQRLTAARALGTHTSEEWSALLEILGHKCVRCGTHATDTDNGKLGKDHIKPIYQGGDDSIWNIQPMCRRCNSSKGADATDLRENARQDWLECMQKRMANAWQMPDLSPSPSPVKEPVAKATGKKTTMPTGFDLTPERRAYAQQQRISDVEREWSKFIDYCLSNRKLYADWDAAWRNWCRSPYQQPAQNRSGGNGQRSGSPGSGSLAGAMRAVLAAGGEPGIRTGGVSGGQAFDAGTTSADPDPFAELDAAFGSPVRHPGSHALPVIDQEPVEG